MGTTLTIYMGLHVTSLHDTGSMTDGSTGYKEKEKKTRSSARCFLPCLCSVEARAWPLVFHSAMIGRQPSGVVVMDGDVTGTCVSVTGQATTTAQSESSVSYGCGGTGSRSTRSSGLVLCGWTSARVVWRGKFNRPNTVRIIL
jgi:hypothetical protein